MTNKMFYAALARLLKTDPAVHVSVYDDGLVGLRVDGGSTQVFLCPITYVTYRTTGRYFHMASAVPAGEALGLSPRQARQIMLAADEQGRGVAGYDAPFSRGVGPMPLRSPRPGSGR